jgi:hypothetical protein
MEKIFFIHIPKTAGATFRSILKKNYSKKESFIIHDQYPEISLRYLKSLSETELNKFNLIAGHGAQYLHNRARQFKSIIYVRDPVKQIISGYYHIKRSPGNLLHKEIQSLNSLEEYVEYLTTRDGLNFQTYYLSRPEKNFFNKEKFREIEKYDYLLALEILKKTDYIFLTEYFDESLLILNKELNLKKINYISRNISTSRSKEENNNELINKIKKAQSWDYKLYNYAHTRFEASLSNYHGDMGKDLLNFRSGNKRFNDLFGSLYVLKEKTKNILNRIIFKEQKWQKKPVYD